MLFKFPTDKLSGSEIAVNVQNVESLRWDEQGSVGVVVMSSGSRHRIYRPHFDRLELMISRIPLGT
jgi:hypothetical protein